MSDNSLPMSAKTLAVPAKGPSTDMPPRMAFLPSAVTLSPQAFSRFEAALRPLMSRLSSANSSTKA